MPIYGSRLRDNFDITKCKQIAVNIKVLAMMISRAVSRANMQPNLEEVKSKTTKVTLYLSPEVHSQLKVQSALEDESMSTLAEKALVFFLENPDVVEERQGQTHRLYPCPACETPLVFKDGSLDRIPSPVGMILKDPEIDPLRVVTEVPALCR